MTQSAAETPGEPPGLQATPTQGGSPGDVSLWSQATLTPGVGFKQRFYSAGQIGGNTYALGASGAYAYLGIGARLVAVDLSDPAKSRWVGQTDPLPGVVRGMALREPYAFVAAGKGHLRVIDIANPAGMNLAGRFDVPLSGAAFDTQTQAERVFITRDFIGLGSVQTSDPANLKFLGSERSFVDGAPVRTSWKLALYGQYALLADVNLGFRVVTQDTFEQVAVIDKPQSWREVIVDGQIAYATTTEHDPKAGDPEARRSLRVVDLSHPTQPRLLGCLKMEHSAEALALQGQLVYFPDALEIKELKERERAALHVIDVSNSSNPVKVGQLELTGQCPQVTSIVIKAKVAYLGDRERGLCLVDLSNPAAPVLVGTWKEIPTIYDLALV